MSFATKVVISVPVLIVATASTVIACTSTTRFEDTDGSRDAGPDGAAGYGTGGSSASGGSAGSGGTNASGGSGGTGGLAGSTGSGGSGGASGSAGAGGCPTLPGPPLVPIDNFCVDRTEVTGQQYEEFVTAKNGDMSGQVASCTQNASYIPSDNWPIPTDYFDKPVIYVDWCDAYAYCAWAGKRLCGKIGGGSNPYDAFADANGSQWYRTCSNGGRNDFPYGSTYEPNACNGYGGPEGCNAPIGTSSGTCEFSVVGAYGACQGVASYAGVFDLSGNALEWEDSCTNDAEEGEICRVRGGGIYAQGTSHMACDYAGANARLRDDSPSVGFRCCYP